MIRIIGSTTIPSSDEFEAIQDLAPMVEGAFINAMLFTYGWGNPIEWARIEMRKVPAPIP